MTASETIASERLYTRLAQRYDSVFERAILAEGRLTELAREKMHGRRVLDLACGNGRWLERLPPCALGDYVGLDLNAAMLSEARSRWSDRRFVRGDMAQLPFADGAFEGVMSMFGAMGHLPPEGQHRMVEEVARVLTPGGVAILTNGNTWSPFNLPTTLKGNRVRLEGVRFRVHSTSPRRFPEMLRGFRIESLESYDYSYIPIVPLKFATCLLGRDWRRAYQDLMSVFDHCRYIPSLRWFGKQLVAICQKSA